MTDNDKHLNQDLNDDRSDDLTSTKLCGHYRRCFETSDGMEVYRDLFCRFGYFEESSHVVGDPYTSSYRNGQRELMVYILRRLAFTPDDFKTLLRGVFKE